MLVNAQWSGVFQCLLPCRMRPFALSPYSGHLTLSGFSPCIEGAEFRLDFIQSVKIIRINFQGCNLALEFLNLFFARSAFSRASLFSSNAALALSARSNASTLLDSQSIAFGIFASSSFCLATLSAACGSSFLEALSVSAWDASFPFRSIRRALQIFQ